MMKSSYISRVSSSVSATNLRILFVFHTFKYLSLPTMSFPSQTQKKKHSSSHLSNSNHLIFEFPFPFPWRTESSFSFSVWVSPLCFSLPSMPRIYKLILFNYTLTEHPNLPSPPSIAGIFLS